MNLYDIAKHYGDIRTNLHKGQSSQRLISKDSDTVGLLGEILFALKYGYAVDLQERLGGDNGVDFSIALKFTMDVKTTETLGNLLVEKGKVKADVYVLTYLHENKVEQIGWEWGRNIELVEPKDFGKGIINHYIWHENLKPMSELEKRICRIGV